MIRSSVALPVAASDATVLHGQFGAFGGAGFPWAAATVAAASLFVVFVAVICEDGD